MISPALAEWIRSETGRVPRSETARPVSGGCIHDAEILELEDGGQLFLKQNSATQLPLFEAEKWCLELIRSAECIRAPEPYCLGLVEGRAFFAMEGISLGNRADNSSQRKLGVALADLHRATSSGNRFGAERDNFIGATPQPNPWTTSWPDFFVEHRLGHQFRLAGQKGKHFAGEDAVRQAVHAHLAQFEILPSLLHGDLWGGNVSFDETGNPVLFDPACYFGDREADLAFTHLFGGFGPAFYEAYRESHPEPGTIRHTIYTSTIC